MFTRKHIHYAICALQLCISIDGYAEKKCPQSGPEAKQFFEELAFDWSRTLAEVAQKVSSKHYKFPKKLHECWSEAINSFVHCLDPHSCFLPPKAYKQIMQATSGSFGGIGVVIDNTRQAKDSTLTIIDVLPGGPAEDAGMQPLDKIVEADDATLEGKTTEEIIAKLKGKPGTPVELKIMREKHPDMITMNVTRDIIKEQSSLCFYLPDQQVYYVSLSMFNQQATNQIKQLLQKSHNHSYKGLILDLRNNSGGLLTTAIDIAGMFLPNNSLVVETRGQYDSSTQEYRTHAEPIVSHTLPIFILINNYTASAAEILAGCLHIHSQKLSTHGATEQLMVFLVGEQTFGKGSVQEIMPIGNNSALKLTTALYYLPENNLIQGVGITPDFVVERMMPQTEQMKWFTKTHGREHALQNYIKTDASKKSKKKQKELDEQEKKLRKQKKWADRAKLALNQDTQFKAALTLINIFDMGKQCADKQFTSRQSALAFMNKLFVGKEPLKLVQVGSDYAQKKRGPTPEKS